MHPPTHMYTHTHKQAQAHTLSHTHTHTQAGAGAGAHALTHTYTQAGAHTLTHMYTHTQIYIYISPIDQIKMDIFKISILMTLLDSTIKGKQYIYRQYSNEEAETPPK